MFLFSYKHSRKFIQEVSEIRVQFSLDLCSTADALYQLKSVASVVYLSYTK